MCQVCEDNGGELTSCQDCGRLICFDEPTNNVDVIDRAYVTESGDLYCARCGRQHDEDQEKYDEEEGGGYYEPPSPQEVESWDSDEERDIWSDS